MISTPSSRIIMLVDMNSYFASVEQQANPLLRGQPVGVCAYVGRNGCVVAASVEAKARGAYTGIRVSDAQKLIPDMIFLENNPDRYRSVTRAIYKILADYSDRVDHYSIDEAFLDLTGWVPDYNQALVIGRAIKQRITSEIGEWLRCSVGVGPSRFVAKLATDLDKPDGLLAVGLEDLDRVYKDLPLTTAWGIGRQLAKRLYALGIYDLWDLKHYPVTNLMQVLGQSGYLLWAKVNGLEVSDQHTVARPAKSIGHTYCIPRRTTDKKYLAAIISKLCHKAGERLVASGQWAYGYSCGWSFVDHPGHWTSRLTAEPIKSSWNLMQWVNQELTAAHLPGPVSFLGVNVWDLRPPSAQLSFFNQEQAESKVGPALDRISRKFGSQAVIWGRMWGTEGQALDRIGFRKTVERES